MAVSTADDWQDAIAQANGTGYGLGVGRSSPRDVAGAVQAMREIDAGSIHVNWTPLWRADLMPYGGLKGSGIGKEGPRSAVERDDRGQDGRPARPSLVSDQTVREGDRPMTLADRRTVRLTVAQALVRYLSTQYSVADGDRRRLVPAALGIFGHGNVAGMGQALDQLQRP